MDKQKQKHYCRVDFDKSYMTLTQLADLWGVPLEDIRYLGEEGELTICIRRFPIKVAIESILEKAPYINTSQKAETKKIYKMLDAPQPLHPTDVYLLFANRNSKIPITRFKTAPIMKIIKICSPLEIEVGFDDMVVTASERKRFEFAHSNKILSQSLKEPLVLLAADFSFIRLYDKEYHFGEKQALAIKYLYDRYYSGNPWVHGKILLKHAGSESFKLANLFSKNKDWREVIISNSRGFYRINLPFEEPAPSRRQEEQQLSLFNF